MNTSGEDQKSGISPDELLPIYKEIHSNAEGKYEHVKLNGLMTIGKLDGDAKEDFLKLSHCRDLVAQELGISPKQLELSMGMSSDYQQAVSGTHEYHRIYYFQCKQICNMHICIYLT